MLQSVNKRNLRLRCVLETAGLLESTALVVSEPNYRHASTTAAANAVDTHAPPGRPVHRGAHVEQSFGQQRLSIAAEVCCGYCC